MQPLITYKNATDIDTRTQEEYHISASVLMERAGYECAKTILPYLRPGISIVVLCGSGNNGGDAQVLSRILSETSQSQEYFLRVVFITPPRSPLAKEQYAISRAHGVPHVFLESKDYRILQDILSALKKDDIIVDAISGVGQKGRFRHPEYITSINASHARVISIDVPSGLPPSYQGELPIVRATVCLTMGAPKQSMYHPHYREYCGEIRILNPGFPRSLLNSYGEHTSTSSLSQNSETAFILLEKSDIERLWEKPSPTTYKNKRGVVAIAAGCKKMPGAALLAIRAASQGAAGVVHGLLDEALQERASLYCPSALIGTHCSDFSKNCTPPHVCVIGSGWGRRSSDDINQCLRIPNSPFLVLDADALRMLPSMRKDPVLHERAKILTPHIGELRHLCEDLPIDTENFSTMAMAVARAYNAIVVAKSSISFVVSPYAHHPCYVIDGRCALLATAGSGDVLAGFLGSMAAYCSATQTKNEHSWDFLHRSAALATLIHSETGKYLTENTSHCSNGTLSLNNAEGIVCALSNLYSLA